MAETSDNAILYVAVYNDVGTATADLSAFDRLHKAEVIGKYDAAVIDKEDGKPHIVKRADHPAYRVIPEWFGSGSLTREELHDAADALDAGEAALIVVGEPTLEQYFEKAFTRANRAVKRDLTTAVDELERELHGAVKK